MDKNNTYKIDLLGRNINGMTAEYEIDDKFFQEIDGLIQRGQIHTTIHAQGSASSMVVFEIHSVGTVFAPCDRCLADIELRIDTTDSISVKLGDEYSDEGEVVVVPEKDGMIDLSQFIYEFIALSLPLKLIHEPGKCDEAMIAKLEEHLSARSGEDDEETE
ncbi:MAG: DUF177 domain-containing protein [Bacteroidaceae bacterium]|nr:DUF177 domain-containing protein [Bacteroidaceae bacterium]